MGNGSLVPVDPRVALCRWLADGRLPGPSSPREARLLAEAAAAQGLAAHLDEALASAGSDWGAEAHELLRDAHRSAVARGIRLLGLARRVQTHLTEGGVRALVLKGVALMAAGLVDPGRRPASDVDVLALDDWGTTLDVLARRGFRATTRGDHALGLRDPESDLPVELHWSPISCPGFYPWSPRSLWERHQEAPNGLFIPGYADMLVHLALHSSFQHGLVLSLAQHLDFRVLLESSRLDPSEVLRLAREWRAERELVLAVLVASTVAGFDAPSWLPKDLLAATGLPRTVASAERAPHAFLPPAPPGLAALRWELCRGRRAAFLRATLAPPPWAQASFVLRSSYVVTRGAGLGLHWSGEIVRALVSGLSEKGPRV